MFMDVPYVVDHMDLPREKRKEGLFIVIYDK